jgi:hypothetical protein
MSPDMLSGHMLGHDVGDSGEGKEEMCPDADVGYWICILGVPVPVEFYPPVTVNEDFP